MSEFDADTEDINTLGGEFTADGNFIPDMDTNPVTGRPTKEALEAMVVRLRQIIDELESDDIEDRNTIRTLEALLRHENEVGEYENIARKALEHAEQAEGLEFLASVRARQYLEKHMGMIALAYKINDMIDNYTTLSEAALAKAEGELSEEAIDVELQITGVYDEVDEKVKRERKKEIIERLKARHEKQARIKYSKPEEHAKLVSAAEKEYKASPEFKQREAELLDEHMPEIHAEAKRRALAQEQAELERRKGRAIDEETDRIMAERRKLRSMYHAQLEGRGIDTRKLLPGTKITVILGDMHEFWRDTNGKLQDWRHGYDVVRAASFIVPEQSQQDGTVVVTHDSLNAYESSAESHKPLAAGVSVEIGHVRDGHNEFSPRLRAGTLFSYYGGLRTRDGSVRDADGFVEQTDLRVIDVEIDGLTAHLPRSEYAYLLDDGNSR